MTNLVGAKTAIRESTIADAERIFYLRLDPRLRPMQYRPSLYETPLSLFGDNQPGVENPKNGSKCATILVDGEFAGHIIQLYQTPPNKPTLVTLGWNLIPELWGKGIMVQALNLFFESRFAADPKLEFIAHCFASNQRSLRVIEKLGFRAEALSQTEWLEHFLKTWGRQRVTKHRLCYNLWLQRPRTCSIDDQMNCELPFSSQRQS
jgi:RimJ/RimL family protein N-acetyltransferase